MNSLERVRRRLRGASVDHAPNFDIVMAFASHHIGAPLSRFYLDYRILGQANLAACESFGLDILQTISDPYREATDLGLEVDFPHDGLPLRKQPLLARPEDVGLIRPQYGARMTDRIEAVRLLCDKSGGQLPVMGWVEGALALANVLRGDTALMLDLYDRPDWVDGLLEKCVQVGIAFARAQVEAGAHIVGLGDAIASQVSPAMYRRFALPYEQRIFDAVHEAGALCRLHICGNTSRIVADMSQTGADIIDLDWMVDLGAAAKVYGASGPAVCGNFDPVAVLFRGSPDKVRDAVARCLERGGPRCISAAGCEVPDGTPIQNMLAHRDTLMNP